MTSPTLFEERMRRFCRPDGCCIQCRKPADRHHPVGPITITVSEPDDCGESRTHEFCEWRCFAHWAAVQAGGDFVVGAACEDEDAAAIDAELERPQHDDGGEV